MNDVNNSALATVNNENKITNIFSDPKAMEFAFNTAVMLSKAQFIPQAYQGRPENCLIAVDMANRLNTSPMFIMQNLYVVKGKPSWTGAMCKTLVEQCGKYSNVHHVYFGQEGTEQRGCMLVATRLSDGQVVEGPKVTIGMARAEGWTSNAKWRTMPELMLAYRANAFFARVHCPEALLGYKSSDEVEDIHFSTQRQAAPDPFESVGEDAIYADIQ